MTKIFLMVALYCCCMNAMDAPVAQPIELFNSSFSLELFDPNCPKISVQQQLADIVLTQSLYDTKKLDSHTLGINAVVFKPDGKLFASTCTNLVKPTVTIFSPDGEKSPIFCKTDEEISTTCAAFSFDGSLMLCASGKNLYFWDTTKSWKLGRTLSLDTILARDVCALAFSKRGHKIIIGGGAGENNLSILTQKDDGSSYIRELSGHEKGAISCVGFSPDSTRAISVCGNEFRVWDVGKASLLYEEHGTAWSNCKVEYDIQNAWFLTGYDGDDSVVGYWFSYDLHGGKKRTIQLLGNILPNIKSYERSACGNYIFLGSAQTSTIFVFNLDTKQFVHTITVESSSSSHNLVSTITCSPDGKFMACVIKEPYESHLHLYHTMSDEGKQALQDMWGVTGDKREIAERLIHEIHKNNVPTLHGDAEHRTFDRLPDALKRLLLPFIPNTQQEEHNFTLLDGDDEWTLIEK